MCDITEMIDEYHTQNGITKLEAAECMGIDYSIYKQKTSVNYRHQLAVKELIPFIKAHNMDCRILDRIEQRLGRVAFPIPNKKTKVDHHAVAKLAKEAGEAISACAKNIDANNADEEKKRECRKEVLDLVQVANTLLMALND